MQILRPHLPGPGEPKKSTWQLHLDSGLGFGHVSQAVLDLRDVAHTQAGSRALIWYKREGYGYSDDRAEVSWFYLWRMRTGRTIVGRLYTGVLLPYWSMSGISAAEIHRRSLVFDRLLEDMDTDIADLALLAA